MANLQNWVNDARKYMREFSPKLYRALRDSGQVEAKLQDAAERSHREMQELQEPGFKEHEAWEIVRERYLFTPEESKEERAPGQPLAGTSAAKRTNSRTSCCRATQRRSRGSDRRAAVPEHAQDFEELGGL